MSRKTRTLKPRFRVFCEGDTEYHYYEYIRKNKLVTLNVTPVNMFGGGYSNFLKKVKEDSDVACLAKFIVIDGDKATDYEERKKLVDLIKYCIRENKSRRTPHILIINSPDFEYVACLHCEDYKGGEVDKFIRKNLKYRSIEDFKADTDIYNKLNSGKNSYKNEKIIKAKRNAVVENVFTIYKSTYEIFVELSFIADNIGKKGSNMKDFFDVVKIW